MSSARTAMLDLHVQPAVLSDPVRRSDVIQAVEGLLETLSIKKLNEHNTGESLIILYTTRDGSITALLKTYPFGLITISFEESLKTSPFTNPKLEEFRKQLQDALKIRVENTQSTIINVNTGNILAKKEKLCRIPVVKRGAAVPLYFTTSDERLLEYDFDQIVYEADSRYQNIKILHSPTLGNCLFLDDLQNLGEQDLDYTRGLMKHGKISYSGKEVLILGGGDGGLLCELLREKPKFVTMVDIDKMVLDACKLHLRGACGNALDSMKGSNYEIIVDDCIVKLAEYKESGRDFDIIINDLTDIPISTTPQGELWDFVKKIVIMSLEVLRDQGHYLNHALGENCGESLKTYEGVLGNLPAKVEFSKHVAYVPSFMEGWVFYDIWKV